MDMTLSIAVRLVGGPADYLVKVSRPMFGIILAAAARTPHKHDNVQRVNAMVLEDTYVPVKEMSVQPETGEASVCRTVKQLGLKRVCAR
jgi:hypothetical protein